ncbi:hypothetical protein [Geminicoccus harenae]|uniref:hypothetical protein n=1 Tax=Geminicoccus harenae TaxID=2498453 RepID=UPI00168B14EA|nr:hypothetical protein [Geminicoccus harenae]
MEIERAIDAMDRLAAWGVPMAADGLPTELALCRTGIELFPCSREDLAVAIWPRVAGM